MAAVGPDIRTHELLPHSSKAMEAVMSGTASREHDVVILLAIVASAYGELKSFETVVVRQESGESAKGIWWGRGVGQDVS